MEVEQIREYLDANPGHIETIRSALSHYQQWESKPDKESWEQDYFGFEYHELSPPGISIQLRAMVQSQILKIVHKSRKSTHYVLIDPLRIAMVLEDFDLDRSEVAQELPEDLFDIIVGYNEAKELFTRALGAPRPIHLLLLGPPASAKTLFLMEILRLGQAEYHLGSSTTRAGLLDLLFGKKPRFLLIDEVDKMAPVDQDALLSLCETGIIKETKYGRFRSAELDTRVFAASNQIQTLRPELVSRFGVLAFPEYGRKDFIEVVSHILVMREDLPEDVALEVAKRVWDTQFPDPREASRIARLMKEPTMEEVDLVFNLLGTYRG